MFSLSKSPLVTTLLTVAIASISFAQQPQTPSQRFKPVRNVPPSVHVPEGASQRIAGQSSPVGRNYNFSDTPIQRPGSQRKTDLSSLNPASVQQVNYQEKVQANPNGSAPKVSNNLGGSSTRQRSALRPPASAFQPNKTATNSASQYRQGLAPPPVSNDPNIVVDQQQFDQHEKEMQRRLDELKRLRQLSQQQQNGVSATRTQTSSSTNKAATQSTTRLRQTTPAVERVAVEPPKQADNPVVTAHAFSGEQPFNNVRQASAETAVFEEASVNLATPKITVQSIGPAAIGINKLATYKVTVTNGGKLNADRIQIGLEIPAFVELQNVIASTGHHDVTGAGEVSRLNWTIERIAPQTTQTITINMIPRAAQPFDMGINWHFLPRAAKALVQVTEPKLLMNISGPTEVLYGEKATYDVTVTNPGTGEAEQVSVKLPEALGGEQAPIGNIQAGGERRFKVELFARTAGPLNLAATAVADGNIKTAASHDIMVRRANLNVSINGPTLKYAGSVGQYVVTISNDGDASANEVAAVLAMPNGVKYLSGIDSLENNNGGLKWKVGTLAPGNSRTFNVNCQLDASGQLVFQAGARGAGDLQAAHNCQTKVDTIADLTLDVEDPKGPIPTGENVDYLIVVKNRGTRSANGVDLVMQFSEGIEPVKADGFKHKIVTGQVIFAPITRIEPGQEIVLKVTAQALKSGTHIFRAQLNCEESDSREIGEGTTRFFGDPVVTDTQPLANPSRVNTADADATSNDFVK